ncbi:MAG: Omp28-related outer membrane protein [Rikenellaceae bacterium]
MRKLFLLLSLSLCTGFYSCQSSDEDDNDTSTSGTLVIEVDTQSFSVDEEESVTFTVLLDGDDVTSDSQIINITDGGYDLLDSNVFSTLRPGTHTFFALYGSMNSDQVSVLATSESNLSSTYYRRNIIMKFTATSCTYCPTMGTIIESAMKSYPDRLIEVAVHNNDELSTTVGNTYGTQFNIQSLPSVVIDMNEDYLLTSTTGSVANIIATAEQSTSENPTVVGITAETTYSDGKLSVDVEATFVADGNYKLLIYTLQSGYSYEQSGTYSDDYTQDHVITTALTDASGDDLGSIVISEKIKESYEISYNYDTDQTEVVVCILNQVGTYYYVNNAISMGVNESVAYQFEQNEE